MKKIQQISLLLLVLVTSSSCVFEGMFGIQGNRHVITENRTIKNQFDAVSVQQGIHLYLSQGNETSLKVEADENIMPLLVTKVEDNTLKIYFKKNVSRAKARNVYLSTNAISKISASSGSSVTTEATWLADSFELKTSSGSAINCIIKAHNIIGNSSSGSSLKIKGESKNTSIKASSGSSINCKELQSDSVTAKASSGATIKVMVNQSLNAKASSGASIRFLGNPTSINKEASSGGSVTQS
ncbi:MAG: head GIN domain-containing protein [Lutibacter sp.]